MAKVKATALFVAGPDNLAYNCPCRQSSTMLDYPAHVAVNGVYEDFLSRNDLSVSSWWTVDLQNKYSIGRIYIYSGKVCNVY